MTSSLLDQLSENERRAVLAAGPLRRYRRSSWLFHQGDPARSVWAVTAGTVKVQKTSPDGKVTVLGFRDAGCLLGEQSALDGEAVSAGAVALTDVEAVVISVDSFHDLLGDSPALATALLQQLNRRLRQASSQLHDIATSDAVTRVANRLVDLTAEGLDGTGSVRLPMSQQDLADWVGLSREAVVRALRVLRDEAIIETGRLSLTVLDPGALEARGGIQR